MPKALTASSTRLLTAPQKPRTFFLLLPQCPSCSHLSHLGSGHWPVSHPQLNGYLVTVPLQGIAVLSQHGMKGSDPCERTFGHQLRQWFIFRGRDQECHSDPKSRASGDSGNMDGEPRSLWFNLLNFVPQWLARPTPEPSFWTPKSGHILLHVKFNGMTRP